MVRKNDQVLVKSKEINVDDLKTDEIVIYQLKHYFTLVAIFCFLLPTIIPHICWDECLVNSFFVCVMLRYVWTLHMTWLVNSAAHYWGDRPYDPNSSPRENWFVALGALGEGFHNYHHKYPNDYATSALGANCNLSTAFINLCIWIKLADKAKRVSKYIQK